MYNIIMKYYKSKGRLWAVTIHNISDDVDKHADENEDAVKLVRNVRNQA